MDPAQMDDASKVNETTKQRNREMRRLKMAQRVKNPAPQPPFKRIELQASSEWDHGWINIVKSEIEKISRRLSAQKITKIINNEVGCT